MLYDPTLNIRALRAALDVVGAEVVLPYERWLQLSRTINGGRGPEERLPDDPRELVFLPPNYPHCDDWNPIELKTGKVQRERELAREPKTYDEIIRDRQYITQVLRKQPVSDIADEDADKRARWDAKPKSERVEVLRHRILDLMQTIETSQYYEYQPYLLVAREMERIVLAEEPEPIKASRLRKVKRVRRLFGETDAPVDHGSPKEGNNDADA